MRVDAAPMADHGAWRAGGVWSVGALIGAVATTLEHEFSACTVTGEISGFSRAASGHCYFNLKDPTGSAAIRCAMFRRASTFLAFAPADGQAVEVRGRVAVYEQRGELQLVVEAMQRSGAGALFERFLRLRARLEAEGLFSASLKRPLPGFAASVGVVTSLAGAALHDVVTTLARRSPHVRVVVYPSAVQGIDAPAALCQAIHAASCREEVDVLIVCRGGGSLEDLWAFNDERVARAIRAAPMPVVSGVGHETDVTLADLAADVRAATPASAAELVAPATAAQRQRLEVAEIALARRTSAAHEAQAQHLDRLSLRLARPAEAVRRLGHGLDLLAQRVAAAPMRSVQERESAMRSLAGRLRHAAALAWSQRASSVEKAAARLQALDPDRVLARGYALLVAEDGRAVTSSAQLAVAATVWARLFDGSARLVVEAVEHGEALATRPLP